MLDAAQDALGDRPLRVLTTAGELVPVEEARARPWDVAAANWVATALAVAGAHPDALLDRRRQHDRRRRPDRRRARRRDRAQRPGAAAGRRARLHRRAAHQPRGDRAARAGPRRLVPGGVGVLRDQRRRAPRPRPPARRRRTTARRPTAAPRRVAFARERIARLVCADVEQLDAGEIDAIAAFLHGEQLRQIEAAARRVQRPLPPDAPVVAVGSGAFLGREVAARLERRSRDAAPWGATGARSRRPRRWPRCWRRACASRADRRQGRRRARARRRRRRAARAVRGARRARPSATRCSSSPAGPASPTPCATPTAASGCARRPRTAWRSSGWSSSAGC